MAHLHTKHPEKCDKVGGLLAMHIDDLRALAPMWLSKTEEVRQDKAHWGANITGDIYEKGWISEMYGYSFGAAEVSFYSPNDFFLLNDHIQQALYFQFLNYLTSANCFSFHLVFNCFLRVFFCCSQVGLRHKINDNLMVYPGYAPREGVEPILLHYGLRFSVGNWSFSKADHDDDDIIYNCGRLFPQPPYPREVNSLETDPNLRRGLFLSIECINILNEGLLLHHASNGCPKPPWSKYLNYLKSGTFAKLTRPKYATPATLEMMDDKIQEWVDHDSSEPYPKVHTIFSTECSSYFDWQTVGLMHSFHLSGQPGNITRLVSCSDEDLKLYKGRNLAPTHYVPSMSQHPLTGDW